jgi:hypothetical protein
MEESNGFQEEKAQVCRRGRIGVHGDVEEVMDI